MFSIMVDQIEVNRHVPAAGVELQDYRADPTTGCVGSLQANPEALHLHGQSLTGQRTRGAVL
jgi:hypothetical protein